MLNTGRGGNAAENFGDGDQIFGLQLSGKGRYSRWVRNVTIKIQTDDPGTVGLKLAQCLGKNLIGQGPAVTV